jgi:hypothetical protein
MHYDTHQTGISVVDERVEVELPKYFDVAVLTKDIEHYQQLLPNNWLGN